MPGLAYWTERSGPSITMTSSMFSTSDSSRRRSGLDFVLAADPVGDVAERDDVALGAVDVTGSVQPGLEVVPETVVHLQPDLDRIDRLALDDTAGEGRQPTASTSSGCSEVEHVGAVRPRRRTGR